MVIEDHITLPCIIVAVPPGSSPRPMLKGAESLLTATGAGRALTLFATLLGVVFENDAPLGKSMATYILLIQLYSCTLILYCPLINTILVLNLNNLILLMKVLCQGVPLHQDNYLWKQISPIND